METLKRLLSFVLAAGLALAAAIFASLLLAVVAGVALVLGGWLWWHTRALRRDMPRTQGTVIEGEFRRVEGGDRLR
jgi:hypothetical protein